jgi:FlaA1/EpsC-like NDP-sugar epimerase
MGLYRSVFRFLGANSWMAIIAGTTISAIVLSAVSWWLENPSLPPTAIAIYWILATGALCGIRITGRWLLVPRQVRGEPVIIYGAGEAGARLAQALRIDTHLYPIAFVDDKKSLRGTQVQGIRVIEPSRLAEFAHRRGVRRVLLAIPSASRRRRGELLKLLGSMGLHVQSIPRLDDIVGGRAQVHDLQEVDLADVLGRDQVPPNAALLDACIRGKSVMVTGAGGSIGSELCRQILRLAPEKLVLLEMSEVALYELERELRASMAREQVSGVELIAVLGDAHNKPRMREVMLAFGVQTIYHAAAYKHVPIVERNVIEGVHNNIFSTWYTAEAARETGVETLVLISTDKAVNPTNVMGATKRLAEIVLQALQTQATGTRFCMVRFGNVLGSSGSVVPLFQEQIGAGGPVTVTHPEARRYFMTIPEAAQLVLQAGSMATGGDVFVLDMGQLVRIEILARKMVGLLGLTVRDESNPDGDIEIKYTGLRPGEKLYEELLISDNVTKTDHPMIMRALEPSPGWDEVARLLAELHGALNRLDCVQVLGILQRGVAEYHRQPVVHDVVWNNRPPEVAAPEASETRKVAVLAEHRGHKGTAGTSRAAPVPGGGQPGDQ